MKASRLVWVAAVVLWGVLAGQATAAEEFGDITGEFITEGFVPILPPLIQEVGPPPVVIPDERYVVDKKTGGVANVFIYLRKAPAAPPPELARSAAPEVKITIEDRQFVPHAVVVRTDQKLRFVNKWPRAHAVHTFTLANPQSLLLDEFGKDGVAIELPRPEGLPLPVRCDIHPWMRANMLVVDHPYAAVTDREGKFTIKRLPAGEHSFRVWHESVGYLEREWKVNVVAGRTTAVPPVKIPATKLSGEVAGQATAVEEFGDITGEFIAEGFVPVPRPIVQEVGSRTIVIPDESYVVDKKTGGVANVFVYLRKAPATIAPELKESKAPEVQVTIENYRYLPHALIVRTDQKLRFTSADAVRHQVFPHTLANPQQNFLIEAMDKKGVAIALKAPEVAPMPINGCLYPAMCGTFLVVDHPYAAVTDREGRFTITGLPAGEHLFRVWHEKRGLLEREWKVNVVAGKTTAVPTVKIPAVKLIAEKS